METFEANPIVWPQIEEINNTPAQKLHTYSIAHHYVMIIAVLTSILHRYFQCRPVFRSLAKPQTVEEACGN